MKQPEKNVRVLPSEMEERGSFAAVNPPTPHGHYIAQEDWNRLSSALGVNLKDTTDLCTHVEAMSHIRVEGVDIRLEPGLLHRLRSRCVRREFNEFLNETVLRLLHGEVGW